MIRFLFICKFLLGVASLQAQTALVLKVTGKASVLGNNSFIKPNDELQLTDTLVFHDNTVALRCFLAEKGVFTIENQKSTGSLPLKKNELLATLIDKIKITRSTNQLAGRGGLIQSTTQLTNYLGKFNSEESPLLIIDSLSIELSFDFFTLDDSNFFYLRYQDNQEEVNKKIDFMIDDNEKVISLILRNSYFQNQKNFKFEGKIKPVKVFFYKNKEELSYPISEFYLYTVELSQIQDEICILLQAESLSEEIKILAISEYLNQYYGIVSILEVTRLIQKSSCK